MKGDVMLKANLADLFNNNGEELKLAQDLYTAIEKHGRVKFSRFIKDELNPNARLLTPSLIYLLMVSAQEILQSENASKRASAPRKPKDKNEASGLWKAWLDNPDIYPNKQQFIADVILKCEVSLNTARTWFDEFRTHTSPKWEAKYGNKYPNL